MYVYMKERGLFNLLQDKTSDPEGLSQGFKVGSLVYSLFYLQLVRTLSRSGSALTVSSW